MELIDRYLQLVRTFLPKAQQDDIIKELRANLLSQIEDKESEYGRPLRDDEVEAILKRHGHPVLVASRYRPHQHLIGPVVFPFYWMALKIVLAISILITAVVSIIKSTGAHPLDHLVENIAAIPVRFFSIALPLFGVVTLIAAVLDLCQARFNWWDKWTPSTLPPLSHEKEKRETKATAVMRWQPNSRWKIAANLLGGALWITWWALLPHYPQLIFGPSHTLLRLTPVWSTFHGPILQLLLVCFAINAVPLIRPDWDWLRRLADILATALSLVMISYLLKAGDLVALAESVQDAARYTRLIGIMNYGASAGLLIASVVIPIKILVKVIKLVRHIGSNPATAAS